MLSLFKLFPLLPALLATGAAACSCGGGSVPTQFSAATTSTWCNPLTPTAPCAAARINVTKTVAADGSELDRFESQVEWSTRAQKKKKKKRKEKKKTLNFRHFFILSPFETPIQFFGTETVPLELLRAADSAGAESFFLFYPTQQRCVRVEDPDAWWPRVLFRPGWRALSAPGASAPRGNGPKCGCAPGTDTACTVGGAAQLNATLVGTAAGGASIAQYFEFSAFLTTTTIIAGAGGDAGYQLEMLCEAELDQQKGYIRGGWALRFDELRAIDTQRALPGQCI
jgi:hypothetical protein